jgi:AP-3 complex subunit beta
LAAKVYAKHFPTEDINSQDPRLQQIDKMYQYAMSLARYDVSYNLRDRARYLKNLQLNNSSREYLFNSKPVPRMTGLGERGQEWILGSVAQVVGRASAAGEIPLPEWGSEIPEMGVRDISESTAREGVDTSAPVAVQKVVRDVREKKKEKKIIRDLDKFYASESETEEEDEEDGEDEEDEEGEESGESSEQDEPSESEEETDEDEEENNTERLPLNRDWS